MPEGSTPIGLSPEEAVLRACAAVGQPWVSDATRETLVRMSGSGFTDVRASDTRKRQQRADQRERVLRHLLLSGPDAQLH